jgi:hypothetical protein
LIPEGTDKSILSSNEIAAKQSAENGLNRLVGFLLRPQQTMPDSRIYRSVRYDEELQRDSDLLEGTIEEFRAAIFDNIVKLDAKEKEEAEALEKAKQKENDIATPVGLQDTGPRLIYMICDQRDLNDTKH